MLQRDTGLKIQGLSKTFPGSKNPVLSELNLSTERGELITLIGSSGAGKTTLLRIIAGLEDADKGSITYRDKPLERGDVSYVFQKPVLYPHLNVEDNILFGTRLKAYQKKLDKDHYRTLIEILALDGLEKRKPAQLSGGQAQRVGIARALVRSSPLVLFDEPLASVDEQLSGSIRTAIERLHQELGFTALYITHNQNEALQLGQRVGVLDRGKIVAMQKPEELVHTPQTPEAAQRIHPHYSLIKVQSDSGQKLCLGCTAFGWKESQDGVVPTLNGTIESVVTQVTGQMLQVALVAGEKIRGGDTVYTLLEEAQIRLVLDRQVSAVAGQKLELCASAHSLHFFDATENASR